MNVQNSFLQTSASPAVPDLPLICFSHLRWDFVLQRPQHLMRRFSNDRQVFYFEEYIPTDHHLAYLEIHPFEGTTVKAIRPRVPHWWNDRDRNKALGRLLDDLISLHGAKRPILWFYTPMMYSFARHIEAAAVVYDCMDELANFRFASPDTKDMESALIARADVVFTGGISLYEAKKDRHDNIHAFPSSVDTYHFQAGRTLLADPADQADIPHPRLGYYGVIDERLDLDLIRRTAAARPNYSFVFLGPVAKISHSDLPQAENIHYLGRKEYGDLPAYLSGWDAALMPFSLNEATRFISPTKTPEYLAAGRPVISTKITDVVRGYSNTRGVYLADGIDEFADGCDAALALARSGGAWLEPVDALLAHASWDATFKSMSLIVDQAISRTNAPPPAQGKSYPSYNQARLRKYDYLIVGAGFAGSVLAERLATDGLKVLICDRRPHIAGNAYDHRNEAGILVHKYGPHIFHTNSEDVFAYLSRFTAWRPYEHRVLAQVGTLRLPIPINRTTLNVLYGCDLSSETDAQRFLMARAEPCDPITTSRDVVVSQVGSELYRTFFEGYTRKQWGLDPSELDRSVTARVPTRTNEDDRYFLDTFQAMPLDGYTRMFERMLDHENITIMVDTDFKTLRQHDLANHVIFTGPIDEYFDFKLGRLPYRSLKFQHETHGVRRIFPAGVINFPSEDVPYTRATEYKYLTGQIHPKTSISYEYACADGDPYYPIPRPENQALYKQYEALARELDNVTFVGRLGTYKYYNMDQVVGQALATHRRLLKRHPVASVLEKDTRRG
ncbi:UDP-galactopyranose mutase [Rhizobium sp. Root1220]|uniref:UDP-galactopyranose mutase n=1 Tax=Rhizobium sp. Root1220 TaxID=1736432 RepID=UPI0006F5FE13|nr:UDP-galactopyranose mutase [Rhizobium sp. Root1220]KQV81891.1 UDP-galactopyranose mutase [Rhizobium sp. Root1220]